ncbi:DUF3397 domain-containing protein [Oceanobacillus polygoni]|uniref:Amino acid transporter n=1 Tax=Oceanobacillus polygoni TaxID=1235259 RepID=A0A9X0YRS8_9BACI|nr:DUF3397 domain-containing protein [Oceanobacillus polygoni]MBP2077538.1 amino acid transporter [Oceanobacillus polygoni]
MLDFFIYSVAFFITLPLIATTLIYVISIKKHRNKLRALHQAVNWTTILYIVAVSIMLNLIVGSSFSGWMIVLFLIALASVIIFQWKNHTEVVFRKAIKIIWRFAFLLYFTLYILLALIGVIQRLVG